MNNESTKIVSQAPPTVKTVAVYCRVSTENQEAEGTSLDTQREACLKFCREHNYQVIHQLTETWSGLSLERPKLDDLRQLVRSEQISGIVIYCLDRLSRDPTHGVILQEELERHHVTLEAVTETVESTDLGKLITYIRGYAAKLEAEKIRERTMRGTRARVFDKKLPVTYREPFGYSWDRENKRLVPNDNHGIVKEIFMMALNGKTYDSIITDFKKRHIPSPDGGPDSIWNKHTLSSILHNPLYTGRFYAFKSEVTRPKKKNGNATINSSVRRLPMEQWYYLPEVQVVDPPITLEQRALILDQIAKRQALSQRNAKRDYLLRGMVFCGYCTGKEGRPRIYHGQPHHDSWRYVCPVGGHKDQLLPGPWFERYVKSRVMMLLILKCGPVDLIFSQNEKMSKEDLTNRLTKLDGRFELTINKQATLEDRFLSGQVEKEPYERLKLQYHGQQQNLRTERDKILDELNNLKQSLGAMETLQRLQSKYALGKIGSDYAKHFQALSQSSWKEILLSIGCRVTILKKVDAHLRDYWLQKGKMLEPKDNILFEFSIPIDLSKIREQVNFALPISEHD